MTSDIRYAVRSLLHRKGFALVVAMTLAIGIGSATAIYSVVDWILFRGPPSQKDLYMIGRVSKDGRAWPALWQAHLLAYGARKDVFTELCYGSYQPGNVVVDNEPVAPGFEEVSLNFFKVLNVDPAIGRGFVAGEDVDGRNQVAIVDDWFWKKFLGGSADALGRKITINQQECTVVGVLRKGERLPIYCNMSVFRPLVLHPNPTNPWELQLIVFGRTRPGVSQRQAESALAATKVDLPPKSGWYYGGSRVGVSTIRDMEKTVLGPEMYWVLVGAVGFLFGIACLNATNLMLVRLVGKQHETSIRLALGGGRWGVIRLLLIETFGLCLCGSLFGALIANWLIPLFRMAAGNGGDGVGWNAWHLGPRAYFVLGGLTVVTSLAIAFVPALHVLGANIQAGLRTGGGAVGESPRVARLRATFVVLQATFAVILLVGAGLMVRTLQRLDDVKLGFDPTHRIKLRLNFPSGYPGDPKERLAILDRLKDRLQRFPGVSKVAYGSETLLAGYEGIDLNVVGADGAPMRINGSYISPDYELAGGLVLKGGRWMTSSDKGAVMINESLARVRFGGKDPIGQYLRPAEATGDSLGWQVIGIVGDVRESMRNKPGNKVYMPASWSPQTVFSFVVSMAGEPNGESAGKLSREIFLFDPRIVCYSASRLADARREQLYPEHLALSVLQVLSAIAVLLTVVGMFSILAYTVDRRMGEFGIRMALGATPSSLVSLVMRRGMALTAIGVAAGVGGAIGLTRYMQSLLYETAPYDAAVVAGVAGLLLASSLAACLLPAVRASRPDLSKLLKSE